MRVADLLHDPALSLRLSSAVPPSRLDQEITRCIPSEHLDPTPHLERNVLVCTSGIGMNFTEQSIWDGYAERLAHVGVTAVAFAVGAAHPELPTGLARACSAVQLPLLAVPAEKPLHVILHHVETLLHTERMERFQRGWLLADECARLASQGAEITTLLASIHGTLKQPVAVYDAFEQLIAQYPPSVSWSMGRATTSRPGIHFVPLPMGLSTPCQLAVKSHQPPSEIEPLLTSVTSILAIQLNRSAAVDATSYQDMLRFVGRCTAWSDSTRSDVANAFMELGLSRRADTAIIVANMRGDYAASAWKLRVALHDVFHDIRVIEIDEKLVALGQFPREEFAKATSTLLHFTPPIPLVIRGPLHTLDELRVALVHALDLVLHAPGPMIAPALGLSAIVAAAAGRGARESARRFLAPLIEHDETRNSELLPTLRAWIRNDTQPSRTCEELFIHRNSLTYRLHRIEDLLKISLDTLEGKATCMMALRLVDIEPY